VHIVEYTRLFLLRLIKTATTATGHISKLRLYSHSVINNSEELVVVFVVQNENEGHPPCGRRVTRTKADILIVITKCKLETERLSCGDQ